MAAARQLVVNRDGYVVGLETGEVVGESPICYDEGCEVPSGLPRDEWERRLRVQGAGFSGEMATIVSFRLPSRLLERIDREAVRRELSRSVF